MNSIKGIIFAGCSFTWGQGLYYYSNLPTLNKGSNTFNSELVTHSQVQYMKSLRFPRLVANHFNTFELVHPVNGGSHKSILEWWRTSFNYSDQDSKKNIVTSIQTEKIYYSEVSHLIFQLTQPMRCSDLKTDTDNITFNDGYEPKNHKYLLNWCKEHNIDESLYEDSFYRHSLNNVKNFLIECEQHGIKVKIINWPRENNKFIKEDSFFMDRMIKLEYNNKQYMDMDELMEDHSCMKISGDPELNFLYKDDHPSKLCHQLIAKNIIKSIENE